MRPVTINGLGLTVAYNLIRLWNRLTNSSVKGAGIAVWCDDRILVVRHSYRPGWSIPGGRAKKHEEPRETASREVFEEVGIELEIDDLVLVRESRGGHSLFECQLRSHSELRVDNREVIEAQFLKPADITEPDWLLGFYLRNFARVAPRQQS